MSEGLAIAHEPLTVTELTSWIREAIQQAVPREVLVIGQLSNYKRHTSGHAYFTLKDENATISCVMWREHVRRLVFEPEDGLSVLVRGRIDVYMPQGRYQLYVTQMRPQGIAELELRFRQLVRELEQLGWFDPRHKKPLPPYPRRIGIVTSPSGAAIRDLIRVITQRWRPAELILVPVRVQGDGAAEEIAAAIRWLDRLRYVDVMIVGRGGGSKEDLWAFNERIVAEAIFKARTPIVSAVGHEVDVTVADLVADVRAATPSNAGELVVPDWREEDNRLRHLALRCANALLKTLQAASHRLDGLASRPVLRRPMELVRMREQECDELEGRLSTAAQWLLRQATERLNSAQTRLAGVSPLALVRRQGERCDELLGRLVRATRWRLHDGQQRLATVCAGLESLSPLKVLARGYSITTKADGYTVVRSVDQLSVGEELVTRLHHGTVRSTVTSLTSTDHQLDSEKANHG